MLSLKRLLTEITKKVKNLDDNKINTDDTLCDFSTTAAQNTDDGTLKSFLDTLGWTSTVVINNSKLSIKKTFFKILQRIKTNTDNINNHTTRLTNAETNINNNISRLNTHATNINNNTTNINNNTNRLNALELVQYRDGTVSSSIASKTNINQCRLIKFGKCVFCNYICLTKGNQVFQPDNVICNIPDGFRPNINLLVGGTVITNGTEPHPARIHVYMNGDIAPAEFSQITGVQFCYFWKIP